MNLASEIKADPLLFDKLLEPIISVLDDFDRHPISQAAKILKFGVFIRIVLFRTFYQIISLRDLVEDLRTNPTATALKLPSPKRSTISEAFSRYRPDWLVKLVQHVQVNFPIKEISDLKALGQIWAGDSSYWPIVRKLAWMRQDKVAGIRLHLGLSLNQFSPAAFLLTYDKSGAKSEISAILKMVTQGVTYVLDRGYVKLKFCIELIDKQAFFVIRWRNNSKFHILSEIPIVESSFLNRLTSISDQVVQPIYRRKKQSIILRLVCFTAYGHQFRVLTNRFDLATHQIIMLYAWRWQVELIFRAWKHTLNGLHLINMSENGIHTQFYMLMLASLLWAILNQNADAQTPITKEFSENKLNQTTTKTITAQVSLVFQMSWRILKRTLKLCANCLAQPYSLYVKERVRFLTS